MRHECYMATCRAILEEGRGAAEPALSSYEEAAERWAAFGHAWEHGQALLGAGRCLVELGRSGEASSRLRDARDVFVRLGARPSVEECDGLLERATALSS